MSDPAATGFIGRSVLRREDHRLLRGRGVFVGDPQLPGMLHAVIVRSDHAHARIVGIDTSAADTRTVATARKLVPTANRRIILEVDSGIVGNPHSGENHHFINSAARLRPTPTAMSHSTIGRGDRR
jgi:CO/xanthine dehydrogenase Mo-binding subunit